jgi:hypothetical protein
VTAVTRQWIKEGKGATMTSLKEKLIKIGA